MLLLDINQEQSKSQPTFDKTNFQSPVLYANTFNDLMELEEVIKTQKNHNNLFIFYL